MGTSPQRQILAACSNLHHHEGDPRSHSFDKSRYAAAGLDLLTWDWIPTHPIPRCLKAQRIPRMHLEFSTSSRLSPSERHRTPPFLLTITYAANQCPDCIRQSARPAYYLFPESATVDAHDAASCEMWEHGIIGDVRHIAHEWSSHGSWLDGSQPMSRTVKADENLHFDLQWWEGRLVLAPFATVVA